MNKSKLTELLRYAWLESRTNGLQNNGKSFSEFLELKEVNEAINYTHCCKSDSELLKDKHPLTFAKWRESNGYTPYDNSSYQKNNEVINVDKLEIKYRAYYKTF